MAAITRFGLEGYGVRRTGSFAGKAITPHPVGRLTRFGMEGYGVRRAGSFAGKTPGVATAVVHNALMLSMRTLMGR